MNTPQRKAWAVLVLSVALTACGKKETPQQAATIEEQPSTPTASEVLGTPTIDVIKERLDNSVEDLGVPSIEVVQPPIEVVIEQVAEARVEEPKVALPKIPDRAVALMPDVIKAIDDIWPDMPMRSYFPAQIEQESCITLTHSKCWNPRAELKTAREYGFGLGQITIAYRADGSERFNVFEEAKRQHPDLRNWAWEDRYNPLLQIKAIVVKNRVNWGSIKWETADLDNKMAFLATFYNGGNPVKDRNLCVNTAGCDPSKWWGNVERYSVKSKTPLKEYGNRSLFQISREYPVNVLRVRRPKYVPYTGT